MKRFFSHLFASPFVLVTSLAALIHSSWTLAVSFGGVEPSAFGWIWLGWFIPGLLLAISVDVGLLQISMEIKSGKRDRNRMAGFIVLALAMFILQLAFMITHFPALALSAGVRAEWVGGFSLFRDSLVVIVPLLLPVSITLHTFSDNEPHQVQLVAGSESSTALTVVEQSVTIEKLSDDPIDFDALFRDQPDDSTRRDVDTEELDLDLFFGRKQVRPKASPLGGSANVRAPKSTSKDTKPA